MRRFIVISLLCGTLLSVPAVVGAGTEEEVIALTRAQWAAEVAQDFEGSTAILADDYTEFNSNFPVRIDGKAFNTRLYEAMTEGGGKTLVGEMANAKVQVYGDVAILTYNYIGVSQDAEGETSPTLAKSTRVYVKQNGSWKLVHANFAPVGDDD